MRETVSRVRIPPLPPSCFAPIGRGVYRALRVLARGAGFLLLSLEEKRDESGGRHHQRRAKSGDGGVNSRFHFLSCPAREFTLGPARGRTRGPGMTSLFENRVFSRSILKQRNSHARAPRARVFTRPGDRCFPLEKRAWGLPHSRERRRGPERRQAPPNSSRASSGTAALRAHRLTAAPVRFQPADPGLPRGDFLPKGRISVRRL